jgi:hypothetical protein
MVKTVTSGVKGDKKAFAGETAEFRVTKYNVDVKKVTTSDKTRSGGM